MGIEIEYPSRIR